MLRKTLLISVLIVLSLVLGWRAMFADTSDKILSLNCGQSSLVLNDASTLPNEAGRVHFLEFLYKEGGVAKKVYSGWLGGIPYGVREDVLVSDFGFKKFKNFEETTQPSRRGVHSRESSTRSVLYVDPSIFSRKEYHIFSKCMEDNLSVINNAILSSKAFDYSFVMHRGTNQGPFGRINAMMYATGYYTPDAPSLRFMCNDGRYADVDILKGGVYIVDLANSKPSLYSSYSIGEITDEGWAFAHFDNSSPAYVPIFKTKEDAKYIQGCREKSGRSFSDYFELFSGNPKHNQ